MDTRKKIVPAEQIRKVVADGDWIAIIGLFDPLTATQARRLVEISKRGRRLLAVVLRHEGALFSAEARAVLVAALRVVDAVTIAEDSAWQPVPATNITIVNDFEEDRARSAEFVNFILDRQKLAVTKETRGV